MTDSECGAESVPQCGFHFKCCISTLNEFEDVIEARCNHKFVSIWRSTSKVYVHIETRSFVYKVENLTELERSVAINLR